MVCTRAPDNRVNLLHSTFHRHLTRDHRRMGSWSEDAPGSRVRRPLLFHLTFVPFSDNFRLEACFSNFCSFVLSFRWYRSSMCYSCLPARMGLEKEKWKRFIVTESHFLRLKNILLCRMSFIIQEVVFFDSYDKHSSIRHNAERWRHTLIPSRLPQKILGYKIPDYLFYELWVEIDSEIMTRWLVTAQNELALNSRAITFQVTFDQHMVNRT